MLAECTQLQLLSQIRLYLDSFLDEMFQTILNGLEPWPIIVKGGNLHLCYSGASLLNFR